MTSASNDHGARVTPAGWGTVALASAFLVAGVNTGANLLFLLAGLLLGAVALNRLLVGRQSSACRVTVRAPETVERHALTAVRLRVEPAGRGTGLPLAITVPLPGRARPGALAVQLDGLDRPVEAAFEVAFGRTGRWTLDRVEVASLAPFGLARGARSVPGGASVLVLPPLRAVLPGAVPARREALVGRREGHTARRDALRWLRDHRHGDDSRAIHWRVSARRGDLVVKEFERPTPRDTMVVLAIATCAPEACEAAQILAASLIADRLAAGERVGLAVCGQEASVLAPAEGRDRLEAARRLIARVEPALEPDLRQLQRLSAGLLQGARVLGVTTRAEPPQGLAAQRWFCTAAPDACDAWLGGRRT